MHLTGERGQSSVEWIGIVLLVCSLMGGLLVAGLQVPALGLVHSISRQMLCAVSLQTPCAGEGSLEHAYGESAAAAVRENSPTLMYGRDMLGLPVDYRTCRSPYCAEGPGDGRVIESLAGEPVTLFTRVLDCRDPGESGGSDADCGGGRKGSLYLQYWAYYPESASLRGAPFLEEQGYHRHDWESVQVRIGSDGTVSQRASSHKGHNHSRSTANWGSDMGWEFLTGLAEAAGLREAGGWGESTGRLFVAGGSHAGNVDDNRGKASYPSWTPSSRIRLVPLEPTRGDAMSRAARFEAITPPWRKRLWRDPEATGTD